MAKSIIPLDQPEFPESHSEDVCSLSVAAYFYKYLGEPLSTSDVNDPDGIGMPIASVCGFTCKQAIDAARAFLPFCTNCGGDEEAHCIELARTCCNVLIFG